MVSRFLFRLRAVLPVFVLVIFCGSFNPGAALAKNPYKYTDRTEGDPGDGVLNPVVEPTPSSKVAPLDTGLIEFRVLTLPLPNGSIVVLLPGNWTFTAMALGQDEGRVHDAP